jgi:hypothetical protein
VLNADDLVRSPLWFPLQTAKDGLLFVNLDENAYRAASFLDERILASHPAQTNCSWELVQTAAARLEPRSHYLFHIGHVGSTLISRLIGAHEQLFSVREPAVLRALSDRPSDAPGPPDLRTLLALLSRTWRADQRAVVKHTSIVNEIAEAILAAGESRAIFMFATPLNYLRGIFGGPNSRVESKRLAPLRLRRLARRLKGADDLTPRTEGEEVAMSWLCEMTALYLAALRFPSRVLWVNFDEFLGDPLPGLQAIFRTLGALPRTGELEALLAGPMTRQYSKAPEHAYDSGLRREVLRLAAREHAAEIKRGMDWLARIAPRHPVARAILES